MYTLTIKKDDIILELITSDKDEIAKQLELFIKSASKKESEKIVQKPTDSEKIFEETKIKQTNATTEQEKPDKSYIETSDNISEAKDTETINESLNIAEQKPVTINSIQNPEPEENNEPDFDKILTKEMEQQTNVNPVLKDEKFMEYVESKSATDKLDFLILAAQYLTKYEGLNTFSLKHINSKLMQNFTLIVDHNVLQSAIDKECITKIQDGADDSTTEYMLTEKGLRSY